MRTWIKNLNSTYKKLLIFTIILLAGTLIYSVAFFILNLCIPVEDLSSLTSSQMQSLETRLSIRKGMENFHSSCEIIYFVGVIIVLWRFVTSGAKVKLKELLLFPLGTILTLFLGNVPFVLLDNAFAIDYVIPVLEVVGNILLVFCIASIAIFYKNRKNNL